ncbi:unnamed protein product, partial [Symbiodinium sp. CCMP2456]
AKECRGLAAAHQLQCKVALILKDFQDGKGAEGLSASKSWIRLVDGKWKEVWVLPLSHDLPPWGDKPTVVECKSVPEQVKQATLKVIIPKAFQSSCEWDEIVKKPAAAVKLLLPDELAVRSYGWHKLEQCDEAICGFLKLPEAKSQLVLNNSGCKGVFVKRVDGHLDPAQRAPVKWLAVEKMKAPAYFALARREADKAKASTKRRWAARGVPSSWCPAQMQQLLTSQNWRVISDIQAPARPKGIWTFSAAPPQGQSSGQWFLKCGDQGTIEISPWRKSSTRPVSFPMRAPAAWVSKAKDKDSANDGFKPNGEPETPDSRGNDKLVAPTVIDASLPESSQEIEMDAKRGEKHDRKAVPSPTKPHKAARIEPESTHQESDSLGPDEVKMWDLGGVGDCGFRCLPASNAVRQGATPEQLQPKIGKVALSLRTRAAEWLESNQGAWALEWYADADCTEETEGGSIPQDAAQCDDEHVKGPERAFGHAQDAGRCVASPLQRDSPSEASLWLHPVAEADGKSSVQIRHPALVPEETARDGWQLWWRCDEPGCDYTVWHHPLVRGCHEARRQHLITKHAYPADGLPDILVEAPVKGTKMLWWECPIPECDFKVHRIVGQQGHSQAKDLHLRNVHGMAKAFPFTKAVSLQDTHHRLQKSHEALNLKWKVFVEEFNKKRWKGSHHVEAEPSLFKPAKTKDGSTIHAPWHKCKACGVLVNRSWLRHAAGKKAVKDARSSISLKPRSQVRVTPPVAQASPSVESKWLLWSQAAEEFSWGVRPIRAVKGLAQSLEERQTRRTLRRVTEAHIQAWRGYEVNPGLVRKITRTPLQAEERQAVTQRRWGLAVPLLQKRLRAQLAKGQAKALSEWKHKVHSLSGAASWIKSEGPSPQCLQNEEGQVLSNRPAAAQALREHWCSIFGANQPADTYCEAFRQKYSDYLRPRSLGLSLSQIKAQDLRASLKKMKGKAAGLDGLPQGDPWSPLGLAAVLAAPKQHAASKAPGTECLLYLDDRPLTQKEQARKEKAASVASRIALLPVSLKMRAALCATVFSPIAAWACLLNGRVPDAAELSWYYSTFRKAVKVGDAKGDRSSRDLQKLLLLGHTADLPVVAACRVLKAAARWASYKFRIGQDPQSAALMRARPVRALDSCLPAPWKSSGSWGRWTNGQATWNILAESAEQKRAAHEVRESWRLTRLQRWLAANRNDARDARNEGLIASSALVKRLREIAGQVDGHGMHSCRRRSRETQACSLEGRL